MSDRDRDRNRGRDLARTDPRGEPIANIDAASVEQFETILDQFLSFRGDPAGGLKQLLKERPDFALGRCLKISFLLYQHQQPLGAKIAAELDALQALPLGRREQGYLHALRAWAAGRLADAALVFEDILLDHPRDLLALKLSQDLWFFLGRSERIRDGGARLLPHWSDDLPGYGYLLGMYAFGLEECADYSHAEQQALAALALNRHDTWAVHAGAHVLEMQGRRHDGVQWLEQREADWAADNFFAVHQWWHKTLFYFDLGDYTQVTAVYDQQIRDRAQDLILNLVDASAALWRLYLADQALDTRAAHLAELWAKPAAGNSYPFNDAHAMMALVINDAPNSGTSEPADTILERLKTAAEDGHHAASIAFTACQGLQAFGRQDYRRTVDLLRPIRYDFAALGGSHAQRDVFSLTLLEAALRDGQASRALAQSLYAERAALRPNSVHDRSLADRLH